MIRFLYRIRFAFRYPLKAIRKITNRFRSKGITEKDLFLQTGLEIKTIVEAGASDGVDTLEFIEYFPEAKIYALEPTKDQFNHLTVKFKGIENVVLLNKALDSRISKKEIYVGKSSGYLHGQGSSSLLRPQMHAKVFPEIKFEKSETIETITLTELSREFDLNKIDLLWLDIQGKEFDVLTEFHESLKSKVKLLYLEMSRLPIYEGMPTIKNFTKFLEDSGFVCIFDDVGAISGNRLYLNNNF
jgi:FkbM family methyltransferase